MALCMAETRADDIGSIRILFRAVYLPTTLKICIQSFYHRSPVSSMSLLIDLLNVLAIWCSCRCGDQFDPRVVESNATLVCSLV